MGNQLVFLDLVELKGESAKDLLEALLSSLHTHGISHDRLRNTWLAIASDGCSAMLGHANGLVALL